MPKKNMKFAIVMSKNGISSNGERKTLNEKSRLWGGMRASMSTLETIRRPRIRNAAILMAHPNPTIGTSRATMMGKMTPPTLDPAAVMPRARARCRWNQVDTELTAG